MTESSARNPGHCFRETLRLKLQVVIFFSKKRAYLRMKPIEKEGNPIIRKKLFFLETNVLCFTVGISS